MRNATDSNGAVALTTTFIAISYSVALLAMGTFAWRIIRSGKRLSQQVTEKDKPWI